MFDFLRGTLSEIETHFVVIDVHGVGYRLYLPLHLFGKLALHTEHFFYVSFIVKEESHTLYGFIEKKERDLFEKLIEISGIGPKTALSIIGHLPLPIFTQALKDNQLTTFTRVPGIGKKTAERLIFELRAKLPAFTSLEESGASPASRKGSDALAALLTLGYPSTVARAAVERATQELGEECELSTLIAHALKSALK